ncbi:MAG: GGDEF domain-containing protein [Selenomonadaceae bacterium]|nr:GGDEF domain-containing protein [Selenomonadaceae bacterium]
MSLKNYLSPIPICVAAVVVNLIGSFVARNFNLPLYLDTGGTIFVAMLSGYAPGIVVGFATNFFNSFVEESEMYYCSISIFVAIYTTFLARRGYYQSIVMTILSIPMLAFITTSSTKFIEGFLLCNGVIEFISGIPMNFTAIFLRELVDKGLLVMVMFVAVKFVPPHVKKFFREWGQRQAPLTGEIKRAVYQRKCPKSSLRVKVLLMLMLSSLFIAASIASISYRIFEQACVGVQIKIGDGVATIAASEIDPARVDDYKNFGRAAENFVAVEKKLYAIKDSNPDIKTICIIDADTGKPFMETGASTVALKNFSAEKISEPIFSDNLLTVCKPVQVGDKCICYVAVDISLDLISDYGRSFVSKVLALFSGCFIFVFVIGLRFVENSIILPVNTMAHCAENFVYDNNEHCADNVEKLKRLKIHTGDEIENLYSALLKTTQDVLKYLEKFRRAKKQVAKMDELAHTDSLTGIKNKAAYDEAIIVLDDKILVGAAKFCIAMIDVNFLKRVNDTYGHERGNIYLMNAVKLMSAVFGEEHVYRVGGDEFVVILENDKVDLCKYFVTQFNAEMTRKNSNASAEPWEKVSAAIGVSFYEAGVDKNAEEVFKRADAQMYENKLAMKAARQT